LLGQLPKANFQVSESAKMRLFRPIDGLLLMTLAILSSNVEAKTFIRNKSYNAPTRLIFEFPLGTWIENMAVRANGQLLVTLLNIPDLYLIDPFNANHSVLVHSFPDVLGLSAITEVTPDIFTVSSSNFTLSGEVDPSSAIAWSVDLRGVSISASNPTVLSPAPVVSKIASLPAIEFPNGQCLLSSSDSTVLIGDIKGGAVYRLNSLTGAYSAVIANNYTAAIAQATFGSAGVNGIHVRDGTLYFTNTGEEIFAKVPIHEDGTPAGNTTVIAQALQGDYYDDFTLRGDFAYLVTGSGNSVEKVRLDGSSRQTVFAGSLNSTSLAGPTALAFGRTEKDSDVLYVVTSGGLAVPVDEDGQEVQVGGQVVAIDLSGCS
jgi:hypothetical protein